VPHLVRRRRGSFRFLGIDAKSYTHTSALKFNVSFSDREEAGTMPLAQHGRVNSSRCVAAVFCGRSMDANAESGIPEPKSLPRNHFSFGNELAGAVHK
jgi:hypothetical protein